MAVKKDQIDKIDIEVTTMYYLEAPIKENEILGNTKIVMEEEVIEVLDIYVKEEIQKKNILDYLKEFLLCIDF